MAHEVLTLVTSLGEQLPGQGNLTVLQEPIGDIWPRIESVSRSFLFQRSLTISGTGFKPNTTTCQISNSTASIRVAAEVVSPTQLECLIDPGMVEDEILSVQLQNAVADELDDVLKSNTYSVETEASVWSL
jgi:hypothetical protein